VLRKYEESLNNLIKEVHSFAKLDERAFELLIEAVQNSSIEKAQEARAVIKGNHKINAKIDMNAITMLALYSPEASDLRRVITLLKISSELSRIGDYIKKHAKNLIEHIASSEDNHILIESEEATRDAFYKSTLEALKLASEAVVESDGDRLDELSRRINVEESKCDDFISILEKSMISLICTNPQNADENVKILHTMRKLERVSDRCVNIVKLARYAIEGGKLKL